MPEYNPETILQENVDQQYRQLQEQYEHQWDQINIKARAGLFRTQKDYESALYEVYTQGKQAKLELDQRLEGIAGQLKQIDALGKQGIIDNPDRAKWRLVSGPEAEREMFTQQVDPRDEHRKILDEMGRIAQVTQSYVIGTDGSLYKTILDKDGYTTGKPDKSKPATPDEVQLWQSSLGAMDMLKQAEQGVVQQMADAGIPNPNRLQSLALREQEKSWLTSIGKGLKAAGKWEVRWSWPGIAHRGLKYTGFFEGEPSKGNFAQKVQIGIKPPEAPQVRQPQVTKQTSRAELLMEYKRLGGSSTPEGRAFADKNLR